MENLTESQKEYLVWLQETRNHFLTTANYEAANKVQNDINKLLNL